MIDLNQHEIIHAFGFTVDTIPLYRMHRVGPCKPFGYLTMLQVDGTGGENLEAAIFALDFVSTTCAASGTSSATLLKPKAIFVLTTDHMTWPQAVMAKLSHNLDVSPTVAFDTNASIREELPQGVIIHDPLVIAFMGEGTI